jgi:hypothetical protein
VVQGSVKFGVEQTRPGQSHREFRWLTDITLTLPPSSCFVLTEYGVVWAREFVRRASASETQKTPNSSSAVQGIPPPCWNRDQYELWHLGNPVLSYRKLAPNPFRLFEEFQKHAWEAFVDNPFNGDVEKLRNTVKKLDQRLRGQLLYFVTRVAGQKVGWKIHNRKRTKSAPNRP